MATKKKIIDFNQQVTVQEMQEVNTPDGGTVKDFVDRFTALSNITAANTTQAYANGMDEADTLFTVMFLYSPERLVKITDRIVWGDKIMKPVGDCIITNYGDKRVFKQTVKYSQS